MQLAPISVDCGQPIAPQNGPLESYTDTTYGSEVFYSCDPGLVPDGRMRAVCTEKGWSPNPGDLNCTIATTTHVKPTMYNHTTTPTAIVVTLLDSRGQPVATEHAIPTSADSHLPLLLGLAVGGVLIVIISSFIAVLCVIMKRRQANSEKIFTGNMTTLENQRKQMDVEMKEDEAHEYEVPFSMTEYEVPIHLYHSNDKDDRM